MRFSFAREVNEAAGFEISQRPRSLVLRCPIIVATIQSEEWPLDLVRRNDSRGRQAPHLVKRKPKTAQHSIMPEIGASTSSGQCQACISARRSWEMFIGWFTTRPCAGPTSAQWLDGIIRRKAQQVLCHSLYVFQPEIQSLFGVIAPFLLLTCSNVLGNDVFFAISAADSCCGFGGV